MKYFTLCSQCNSSRFTFLNKCADVCQMCFIRNLAELNMKIVFEDGFGEPYELYREHDAPIYYVWKSSTGSGHGYKMEHDGATLPKCNTIYDIQLPIKILSKQTIYSRP